MLDIDCDLPPALDREELKSAARTALADRYPEFRERFLHKHVIRAGADGLGEPEVTRNTGPLQFLSGDGKQLVQFRPNGYSFNRMARYTTLDDYLPDIRSTWETFVKLAEPKRLRKIGLRTINRMLLPLTDGGIDFNEWLEPPPRLPSPGGAELDLAFLGFLEQHQAVDRASGHRVNLVRTSQEPENDRLPVILDTDVFDMTNEPIPDWATLRSRIESLRSLKNRIFKSSITTQCLSLFSPQA